MRRRFGFVGRGSCSRNSQVHDTCITLVQLLYPRKSELILARQWELRSMGTLSSTNCCMPAPPKAPAPLHCLVDIQ
ncbi:hypothetical protein AB1N83_012008 [Pleurotus pulmonarius]